MYNFAGQSCVDIYILLQKGVNEYANYIIEKNGGRPCVVLP